MGVKLNNFDWGPPAAFEGDRGRERRHTKTAQILLVCAGVLFTNISAWLARELVRELTRDDGCASRKSTRTRSSTTRRSRGTGATSAARRLEAEARGAASSATSTYATLTSACRACVPHGRGDGRRACFERRPRRAARGERVVVVVFKAAISLAAGQKGLLFVALALLACNSALALALPKYQGRIVDRVVRKERGAFRNAVVQYLYLMVAQGLCQAAYQAAFSVVSRNILFGVRTTLFKSVIRQDTAFFDGTTSGHLTSRLTNDAQVMMAPIQASLASLLSNSIMLVGGVTMCFATSYELSMLAFVVVGPYHVPLGPVRELVQEFVEARVSGLGRGQRRRDGGPAPH